MLFWIEMDMLVWLTLAFQKKQLFLIHFVGAQPTLLQKWFGEEGIQKC